MRLWGATFENGHITLELSPFQCADLAAACRFAGEYSFDEKVDTWRTLATLFQACTVAGFAHRHLGEPDPAALRRQLDLLNLGSNDDDNGRLNRHNRCNCSACRGNQDLTGFQSPL